MSIENYISVALLMLNGAALAVLGAPDFFSPGERAVAIVLAGMTTSSLAFLRSVTPPVRLK